MKIEVNNRFKVGDYVKMPKYHGEEKFIIASISYEIKEYAEDKLVVVKVSYQTTKDSPRDYTIYHFADGDILPWEESKLVS